MKMCQAFAENGNKVVLLAPNIKKKYEKGIEDIYEYYGVKKNFNIVKLFHPNILGGSVFYTLFIFFYLLINKEHDLVYGRFLHGIYISTLFKKRVIFESHSPISNKINHRYLIFRKLIESIYFEKLVVISQALKNIYLEKGLLNKSKIQVAHDGADKVGNLNLKIDLLGDKNKLKVGYVGHLYKGRGIDTIIKCSKEINEMTFHLVGGLNKDILYWKNYSKKLNLDNIFFYGFVSPAETLKYRNSFDILLAPYSNKVSIFGSSEEDTSKFMSPLKIFEYMSHKKPIIATDLPVIREVLNKNNSILVKYDDIKSWINSIRSLKEKKNRELISNQAFSDFNYFTWKYRAELVLK